MNSIASGPNNAHVSPKTLPVYRERISRKPNAVIKFNALLTLETFSFYMIFKAFYAGMTKFALTGVFKALQPFSAALLSYLAAYRQA